MAMMKDIMLATCARFGKEIIKVLTSFFIEGIALIDFNGLIALIALTAERLTELTDISIIAEITTMRSKIFHPERK